MPVPRFRLVVLACVAACGGPAPPDSQLTPVSTGLDLVGEDAVPTVRMTLRQARAVRDATRTDDPPPGLQPGERAWFFRGYSAHELVFVEASLLPPEDPRPIKRAARYRVLRRIVVARSDQAIDALGARDAIEPRERGVCGIRVGDRAAEIRARLGPPTEVRYPAAAGCVLETYRGATGGLSITMCFDAVRDLSVLAGGCPR